MAAKTKNSVNTTTTAETSNSTAVAVTAPAPTQPAPSAAMLALFSGKGALSKALGVKRMNMPKLIKPSDIPIGGIISAVIVGIVKSPVSTVKAPLLHLAAITINDKNEIVKTGQENTFPVTGAIRQALAPGRPKDESGETLTKVLNEHVGKLLIAKREADGHSKTYDKDMFIFDVRLSESAVKTVEIAVD